MRSALSICLVVSCQLYAQQSTRTSHLVLSKCQIDRMNVPCTEFGVSFQAGNRVVPAVRDSNPSRFAVPAELEEHPRVDVIISSPRGQFRSGPIPTSRLHGSWQIGVDHAPFDRGLQGMAATRDADCVGWIVFAQPNSEEPAVFSACEK